MKLFLLCLFPVILLSACSDDATQINESDDTENVSDSTRGSESKGTDSGYSPEQSATDSDTESAVDSAPPAESTDTPTTSQDTTSGTDKMDTFADTTHSADSDTLNTEVRDTGDSGADSETPTDSHSSDADTAGTDDPHDTDSDSESVLDSESSPYLDDGSQWVFDDSAIRKYELTLTDADWAHLQEAGNDEIYVPATLQIGDEIWENIGIRLKGSYSLDSCFERGTRLWDGHCSKISMKIKFTEYDDTIRFHGLKRINLHSMSADPTKLHDRLGYHLFELMGSPASRNVPAQVYVNSEYLGIFQAVEEVDGRFTKNRFPENGDGNLFKEIWPRAGVDEEAAFEALKTNDAPEDNPDVSDFLEFSKSIGESDDTNYADTVLPYVDVDQLLRYIAVDRAIHNWDGFLAFYGDWNHNYYWYHKADGTWVLIPWDLDKAFFEYDRYFDPDPAEGIEVPVPSWNIYPANCTAPFPDNMYVIRETIGPPEEGPSTLRFIAPGCDKLVHILASQYWPDFVVFGNEFLVDWFNEDYLNDRIDEWTAQIDAVMQVEPGGNYDEWVSVVNTLKSHLPKMISDFETHLQDSYREEPPL
ncbi:MAG: CotH kinase family protein [Deltaproteobacteria bacterium]|nr:CotH kinase family protein [Deltaproteobacteria bacterium]